MSNGLLKKSGVILSICIAAILITSPVATGAPDSSAGFYQWLYETGTPEHSVSGLYRANYLTYNDYGLVVYGSPSQVSGNEYREGEYRYLGYTYMEGRHTNLEFPNDETGGLKPEEWDYVTVAGAAGSWDSLEQTIQRPYMFNTNLVGHGATELTAADIGTNKSLIQSAAAWASSGSIYTYKSNGFYATFTVPSMGSGRLDAALAPLQETITVMNGDPGFPAGFRLTASVNKPAMEVAFIKAVFHTEERDIVRFFHNTNSIDIIQDTAFSLAGALPVTKVLYVTVTSESIFGDKLVKEVSAGVKVVADAIPTQAPAAHPTVYPTPKPTPEPTGIATPSPAPLPTNSPVPGGGTNPGDSPGDDGGWSGWTIPVKIVGVSVDGAWNHWEDDFPHRFLALEKVFITIYTMGRAEMAVIRFSPELESMTYTNSKGHTYDYGTDFFGEYVEFPEDSTLEPDTSNFLFSRFTWEYNLPLCNETVGWEGVRKGSPYELTVRVYAQDGAEDERTVDDIDITGNIYELLYPQPAD